MKIPINNTVEFIVADLYVNVECKLLPRTPVQTIEGRLALSQVESKINEIFSKAVYEAKKSLEVE